MRPAQNEGLGKLMLDFLESVLATLRPTYFIGFSEHQKEGSQLVYESSYEPSKCDKFVDKALQLFLIFWHERVRDGLDLVRIDFNSSLGDHES